MKKIFMVVFMSAMVLVMAGCTSSTQYGDCIGINDQSNPNLHYKYSAWNIFLGIFFFETVFVPAIVIFDDLKCPVGKAQPWEKDKRMN